MILLVVQQIKLLYTSPECGKASRKVIVFKLRLSGDHHAGMLNIFKILEIFLVYPVGILPWFQRLFARQKN
jgi:hypothetical protein